MTGGLVWQQGRSHQIRDIVHYPEGEHLSVLTRVRINRLLDYSAPEGGVRTGDYVLVPLANRREIGVVWGPPEDEIEKDRIKAVIRRIDVPPMTPEFMEFLEKASNYTLVPLNLMFGRTTRVPMANEHPPTEIRLSLTDREPERMTRARAKVINLLSNTDGRRLSQKQVISKTGVGASVIKGLENLGVVRRETAIQADLPDEFNLDSTETVLTPDQKIAADRLTAALKTRSFSTVMLKGVAGAGKTEVYLEAVQTALQMGRQVLVLLPEIALTSQFLDRVRHRFGTVPHTWHSAVPKGVKRHVWRMTAEGNARLVVGARSALFLPFRDLGLIVVDEEHDDSYKQDEGIIYHARDMAIYRASICKSLVVLSSATPSLETWVNARTGRYGTERLKVRYGSAGMPLMDAIDMRSEEIPSGKWISEALAGEVFKRLESNEQSMLFLNRRGYAPISLCRECGHQLGCPDCDARLVRHMFRDTMICHQCGESGPVPTKCPECHSADSLTLLGPGVERLAEEARSTFPGASIDILSSDHVGSTEQLRDRIDRIARGQVDIVIGTQMVAKGHNFPRLTLVGVIDADVGLQGSDFRAAEKTFQLVRQVAGRAGRADLVGMVLLQTWKPDHPVIRAILVGDDEAFWKVEAREREIAGVPPYGQYVSIVVSSRNPESAHEYASTLALQPGPVSQIGAMLYGPAPAAIFRVRGMARYRLLVHAERRLAVQHAVRQWLAISSPPSDVRVSVDVDPQRFL